MFNKLKQIKDLRDKAKEIQSKLAEEMIEHTSGGVTIKMDGNQKVHAVMISDNALENKTKLEQAIADAINETIKKAQKAMAMKLQKMGDFDLPGLS